MWHSSGVDKTRIGGREFWHDQVSRSVSSRSDECAEGVVDQGKKQLTGKQASKQHIAAAERRSRSQR